LRTNPNNSAPLSACPFRVERWNRQQEVVLARNTKSTLPYPAFLDRAIFRVIPEYTTRITALKAGEIDFLERIQPDDALDMKKSHPEIRIEEMRGRYYDFVGWSNIDNDAFNKSGGKVVKPHPLFGSNKVRRALTMAINRQALLEALLGDYGTPAVTSFSPIFKWALNDTLKPLPYDAGRAMTLLKEEGWEDHNGDGILDKGGKKFAFTIYTNSGNARRIAAAEYIQSDLKKIGIDVKIEKEESNVFFENLNNRRHAAFVSGFGIASEIDPEDIWGSDLKTHPYNAVGFQNKRTDELIQLGRSVIEAEQAAPYWKEFQAIIHEEQPYTYLYWVSNLVAINNRVQKTHVTTFDALYHLYEWQVGTKYAAQ
jgi:peptide/nickel transport system substrate-binding protein